MQLKKKRLVVLSSDQDRRNRPHYTILQEHPQFIHRRCPIVQQCSTRYLHWLRFWDGWEEEERGQRKGRWEEITWQRGTVEAAIPHWRQAEAEDIGQREGCRARGERRCPYKWHAVGRDLPVHTMSIDWNLQMNSNSQFLGSQTSWNSELSNEVHELFPNDGCQISCKCKDNSIWVLAVWAEILLVLATILLACKVHRQICSEKHHGTSQQMLEFLCQTCCKKSQSSKA